VACSRDGEAPPLIVPDESSDKIVPKTSATDTGAQHAVARPRVELVATEARTLRARGDVLRSEEALRALLATQLNETLAGEPSARPGRPQTLGSHPQRASAEVRLS
jgi:hypothetical protein